MPPQNQNPNDPGNAPYGNQGDPSGPANQPVPTPQQPQQPFAAPQQYVSPVNAPQPTPSADNMPQATQEPASQAYGQMPSPINQGSQGQNPYVNPYAGPQQSPSFQVYQNQSSGYTPPKSSGKKLVMIALSLLGLIVLAGVAAIVYVKTKPTPDGVFQAAVANSLSTRQVRQNMDAGSTGSQELQYDLSKEKDPRVYAHAKFSVFQMQIDAEQYATLKNDYVKINEAGSTFTDNPALSGFKGKWMQDRIEGDPTIGNQQDLSVASLLPQSFTYLFGDWIFGNFSPKNKQDLQNFIVGQKIYAYDAKSVVKKHIGNEDVFVYNVTENVSKKTEMNKKLAAIWGVDPAKLSDALSAQPSTNKATLYISLKTKQLVEVDADDSGQKVVNKYTDYNNLKVPSEPIGEADYLNFVRASSGGF